ncbi:MAG: NfeD family protein [Mobilicoccus sp.]|nr:NfeD family protein [Mobilicoccus sp.]
MDWLSDNLWAVWLGLALVLGAVEAATADFIFLMLAGGAVAGLVAGLITASVAIQVIAACAVALLLLGTVRPVLKRRMTDSLPGYAHGASAYVGKEGVVSDPVDENDGRVVLDGETWSARTQRATIPLPAGSEVRVVELDGATLVVEPASTVQDSLPREPS